MASHTKTLKPNWGSDCKSCGTGGGGGDFSWWIIVLGLFSLFGMGWIVMASNWLSSRGIFVTHADCAWEPSSSTYQVELGVHNTEDVFKIASFRIQARFRPPKGERWPQGMMRQYYGATSQRVALLLEPQQQTKKQIAFSIPGVEHFRCTAKVWVGRQERFEQRPSPEILNALQQSL